MQDTIAHILETTRTIAVVGMSDNHERPSYEVAHYLQAAGYRIVPVNPVLAQKGEKVLGETPYADLQAAAKALQDAGEHPIELVDVFRKSEEVGPVAEQAIAIGAKTLWLQLGVHNPEVEHRAAAAGLNVVANKCTKIEHGRAGVQLPRDFAG